MSAQRRPDVDVLVIGGGLAGLAAATALVEGGREVTLVEGRGSLGGRARSFRHARSGDDVDTGQHVLMGCYVEMLKYLDRIGTRHLVRVQERLAVALVTRDGRRASLAAPALAPPFHLAVALLRHELLSPREKLMSLRVLADVRARRGDQGLDRLTAADWLEGLGQSANACSALWEPLCLATLNLPPSEAPASLLAVVLDKAFLSGGDASAIALSTVGLSDLHATPARNWLEARGVHVRLNEPVVALLVEGGRCVAASLRDGRALTARQVVAAVPGPMLRRILPAPWRDMHPFRRLDELGRSPIVSVHAWLDRKVLDVPFVGFIGTTLHWAFDRELVWGAPARGGHLLTMVVSGADELAALDREEVFRRCWAELQAAVPAARDAQVLDVEVVKEREATFRARPGSRELRFGPATPLPGLLVAGDWTDTGLPATMEGACASGHAAAALVLLSG